MSTDPAAPLVWLDLETTGLDPIVDHMLELAVIITDGELNELARYSAVRWCDERDLSIMDDFVRKMHTRTGLLAQVPSGRMVWGVEADLDNLFRDYGVTKDSPLCGSTVHFDRAFFMRDFPGLCPRMHYRNVDVSTIKELVARWRPEIVWQKADRHRALDDVIDSIAELAWYRKHLGL